MRVVLTAEELRAKGAELHRYKTQMDAMSWFFDAFARSKEVFSGTGSGERSVGEGGSRGCSSWGSRYH